MKIKQLPEDIKERIRSDVNINDFSQCILELIFNSLDAKATAVAVRVNTVRHQIQVVDNGDGILLKDIENVGIRYMTSKCESIDTFENKHKYYGYKGESLASIIHVSKKLTITSRYHEGELTYSKIFKNNSFGDINTVNSRSSKGTTVTVEGFFFNCPVKQKRLKNSLDLNNIKITLEQLAIIHPNVSFSLRDDATGTILLNCYKTKTVAKSLCRLYRDIASEDLIDVKVSKDNVHVSGLIYGKSYRNSRPQLIYVNKRPVNIEVLQKHIQEILAKALDQVISNDLYPAFVINVSCPYSEVDIMFASSKILVEFKSWNVVLKCMEKMIKLFSSKYKRISNSQKQTLDLHDNANLLCKLQNKTDKVDATESPQQKRKELNNMDNGDMLQYEAAKLKKSKLKIYNFSSNLKAYRRSLGLSKTKFKMKKKKCNNIFEKTIDSKDLSLPIQDFSENPPLKEKNLNKNSVFLKGVFDDQFDSQNLVFNENPCSSKALDKERNVLKEEMEGKRFVMELFLNSLTPPVFQDTVLGKGSGNEDFGKLEENTGREIVSKSPINTEPVVDYVNSPISNTIEVNSSKNPVNLGNLSGISLNNDQIKKRRMEKLNSVGTSLIKKRLMKTKVNSENKSTQNAILNGTKSVEGVKCSKANDGIKFRRTISVDKSVQTNFIVEDNEQIRSTAKCVQTSPSNSNFYNARALIEEEFENLKGQSQNVHERYDKNNSISLLGETLTALLNSPASKLKTTNFNVEESVYGNQKNHLDPHNLKGDENISYEMTFMSHYNKFQPSSKNPNININLANRSPRLRSNIVVEVDTSGVMNDILNRNVSKPVQQMETDRNYEAFKEDLIGRINPRQDLELNTSKYFSPKQQMEMDKNYEAFKEDLIGRLNPRQDLELNTSKYFSSKLKGDDPTLTKNSSELRYIENNTSVLLDTSMFFQDVPRKERVSNRRKNLFNFSQTPFDKSLLSFKEFVPPYKSTQKDAKYSKRVYDFFESFVFNDQHESTVESRRDYSTFRETDSEWTQRLDNVGNNYYMHKRTGMATYSNFHQESNFSLKKRIDFIPKGLSPIMKETHAINVSLSPPSKKTLNNAIIESYETERDIIKWQDYMDKEDPKRFFDKLYEVKRKHIEQVIPSVQNVPSRSVRKVYSFDESCTFKKEIFQTLQVLGQSDNKFIVALSNSSLIVLLDQHAVHERIRVEDLLKAYTLEDVISDKLIFKSAKLNEPMIIDFIPSELQLLKSFKNEFENIGLYFETYDSYVKIYRVPLCFIDKCANKTSTEQNLYKLICTVIEDEVDTLRSTRGVSSHTPRIFQYIINSQACRGAVKFGQSLTHNRCNEFIKNLSKCYLPFQCAHGRPTMVPILEMSSSSKINLKCNLKKLRRKKIK